MKSLKAGSRFPEAPGVYLMKDGKGNIIYVGKAANISKRLNSYCAPPARLDEKTRQLVTNIRDIDFYITNSEVEALVLESSLIKQYRPHFNINLKDDKNFPYIKIDKKEPWPRVTVTRKLEPDGASYFGPFGSAYAIHTTINAVKKLFPFRTCNKVKVAENKRPCLEYDMGRCSGPCASKISRQEYMGIIDELVLFLEGRYLAVLRDLKRRMKKASDSQQFEKAALIRDQIRSMEQVISYQQVATRLRGDQDVVAVARDESDAYVQIYYIRSSKVIGRDGFFLDNTRGEAECDIIASFVKQYYSKASVIPPKVLVSYPLSDREVIENWLKGKRNGTVKVYSPSKGAKRELVEIVASNARQKLESTKFKRLSNQDRAYAAMDNLKKRLNLPALPNRIEGYDISNIGGTSAVGSMVVFEKGQPHPTHYRQFKIKATQGPDDYSMLQEVIGRRFKRPKGGGTAWDIEPDLLLIDGGKGQLNAAVKVLDALGKSGVPVISLAKENEEVFLPGRSAPVILETSSPELQLLQHVRDEAHRFAVKYYRRVHKKRSLGSLLDQVPGIGPRRRKALIMKFGSFGNIINAAPEEIMSIKGITPEMTRKIKELSVAG